MRVDVVNYSGQRLNSANILRDIKKARSLIKTRSNVPAPEGISIVFVRDSESLRLNRRYRKKNHPANVLSFRYNGSGEIIIAPGVLRRKARALRLPYPQYLRRMVLHGFLHLMGIHHEGSVRQAINFEKLEQRILRHLKIAR